MYPSETLDFLQKSAGKLTMRLLLIVTMRPAEDVHTAHYSIGPAFNEVKDHELSEILNISNLTRFEAKEVILETFDSKSATEVDSSLMDMIEDTTSLHASFVVALIRDLKKCGALKVNGSMIVMSDFNAKVPIPVLMERCGSMASDEYDVNEKIMIKTAAMLSKEFSPEQLFAAFPIESVDKIVLQETFEELLEMPHLFSRTSRGKYRFASSLMSRVFLKMSLPEHLEAIQRKL
jgi:hypothetical protein